MDSRFLTEKDIDVVTMDYLGLYIQGGEGRTSKVSRVRVKWTLKLFPRMDFVPGNNYHPNQSWFLIYNIEGMFSNSSQFFVFIIIPVKFNLKFQKRFHK